MRHMTRTGRFTAMAVACATLAPIAGFAQEPPPPLAQAPAGDPPARVGRLAALHGVVSLLDQQGGGWIPATLNYPITTGSAVQLTGPGRAELQVEGDRFALPGPGELDVTQLDDRSLAATLRQGEVCFSLARVPPGRTYAIQTPRGLVTIAAGGHYAVTAGDTATPTTVVVLDGAAQTSGPGLNLPVGAGQAGAISDAAPQGTVSPAAPDQCLTDLLAEERPQRRVGAPPPRVVQQMTGGEELAGYGTWQPTANDGPVWYPQVAADWVPYRHGHWAFVSPWGWTWCDDAPWGFAPFHYGRWIDTGGRWGWAPAEPGVVVEGPPVYAPALVTFFGVGVAAVAAGALLGGSVGWVPLGPREPYYPWYHASPSYVRQINVSHVSNVSSVVNSYTSNTYNNVTVNRYVNNAGATLVPAAAMARSQPVAAQSMRLAPQQLQTAQPVLGRMAAPVAPGGVAPSAAAFHVPPPQRGLTPGQPALRIQAPAAQVPVAGTVQVPAGTVQAPAGTVQAPAGTVPSRAVGPAGGPASRFATPQAGPAPLGAPPAALPQIRTPTTAVPQAAAPPALQPHPTAPLPARAAAPAIRPPLAAAPAPIAPAAPPPPTREAPAAIRPPLAAAPAPIAPAAPSPRPAVVAAPRPEPHVAPPPPVREAPAAPRPPLAAAPAPMHVMPTAPPPRPAAIEAPRPEPHFAPPPPRAAPPPPPPPHMAAPAEHAPPPRPAPGREKRPGEP